MRVRMCGSVSKARYGTRNAAQEFFRGNTRRYVMKVWYAVNGAQFGDAWN